MPIVKVRREGRWQELSAPELVVGDIVRLEAGNLVPADIRLLETANLQTQEASLTGESEPVAKISSPLIGNNLALGDRYNMAYMGTMAVYGRGKTWLIYPLPNWNNKSKQYRHPLGFGFLGSRLLVLGSQLSELANNRIYRSYPLPDGECFSHSLRTQLPIPNWFTFQPTAFGSSQPNPWFATSSHLCPRITATFPHPII